MEYKNFYTLNEVTIPKDYITGDLFRGVYKEITDDETPIVKVKPKERNSRDGRNIYNVLMQMYMKGGREMNDRLHSIMFTNCQADAEEYGVLYQVYLHKDAKVSYVPYVSDVLESLAFHYEYNINIRDILSILYFVNRFETKINLDSKDENEIVKDLTPVTWEKLESYLQTPAASFFSITKAGKSLLREKLGLIDYLKLIMNQTNSVKTAPASYIATIEEPTEFWVNSPIYLKYMR